MLIDKAASFLTAEGGDFPFEPLEPGQEVVFAGLPEGLHYLFGFFESDLLDDLPVQLVGFEVDAEGGDFAFEILSIPELFMVSRGIGSTRCRSLLREMGRVEATVVEEPLKSRKSGLNERRGRSRRGRGRRSLSAEESLVVEEAVVEEAVVEEAVVEEVVSKRPWLRRSRKLSSKRLVRDLEA